MFEDRIETKCPCGDYELTIEWRSEERGRPEFCPMCGALLDDTDDFDDGADGDSEEE